MRRYLARFLPILLPLILSCGAGVLLTACDGRVDAEGATWSPPPDSEMPAAFAPQAPVPDYAHAWRMPEGFRGFPERWNRRNRDYVQKALETARLEYLEALQTHMQAIPGSDAAKSAQIAMSSALQKFRTL
ncbi:MAG: hypothetical protein IKK15_04605, partial [Akkermansia sp.]|nr:hypothetical protein [Akkermansia sp.]